MLGRITYIAGSLMLMVLLLPTACLAWIGQVERVIDGDGLVVKRNGDLVRIRLYGIDAPETDQYYGQNAKQFIISRVMGRTVTITPTGDIKDKYGRTLAIVSIGNSLLNRELIKNGYARVYEQYCNRPYCVEWLVSQHQARLAKRGLWQNPNTIAPWEFRARQRKNDADSEDRPKGFT